MSQADTSTHTGNAPVCRSAGSLTGPTCGGGRHTGWGFLPRRLALGPKQGDGALEVLEGLKGLVDAGECPTADGRNFNHCPVRVCPLI